MRLIERISKFISGAGGGEQGVYWVSVRCDTCGEEISSRVNLYNDLSIVYDDTNGSTYVCRKTLVGSQGCYKRVEIELIFDDKRRLLEREITGGSFIESE
jgi:DNA-directed RNA polymerase subunit N (RpoN/RPB10)